MQQTLIPYISPQLNLIVDLLGSPNAHNWPGAASITSTSTRSSASHPLLLDGKPKLYHCLALLSVAVNRITSISLADFPFSSQIPPPPNPSTQTFPQKA